MSGIHLPDDTLPKRVILRVTMKTHIHSSPIRIAALSVLTLTAAASYTAAQTSSDTPYTTTEPRYIEIKDSDRTFFEKASRLGADEVALSEVAADRAIHDSVRSFAAQMVSTHKKANADLATLAARKGVALPVHDENDTRKLQKEWSEKKAKDFDEDYLEKLIDAHEDAIDLFEKAVKSKDADIASFAGQHMATFRQHLIEAKALKDRID